MTASRYSSFHTVRSGPRCSWYPFSVDIVTALSVGLPKTVAVSRKCSILSDSSGESFAPAVPTPAVRTISAASTALQDFQCMVIVRRGALFLVGGRMIAAHHRRCPRTVMFEEQAWALEFRIGQTHEHRRIHPGYPDDRS